MSQLSHESALKDTEQLRIVFADYCENHEASGQDSEQHYDLRYEAQRKIRQLALILTQINESLVAFGQQTEASELERSWDQLDLLASSFYYTGFRLGRIFKRLPGLNKVDFKKISSIRNNMVEHPDEDARIFSSSLSWMPEDGIRLRPTRQDWDGTKVHDDGMLINFGEFCESAISKLKIAIEDMQKLT